MIFFLAVLFIFKEYSTLAAPVYSRSQFDGFTPENDIFERSTNADARMSRTIWDILWSCLATTFACTWVSVHPNIPFLRENKWAIKKWRLYLMFLTLLAPEILLMWAFKQCQGALMIKETINKTRPKSTTTEWTMTQAHYLQMGGFRVHCIDKELKDTKPKFGYRKKDGDVYEVLLSFDGFKSLLSSGIIDFPLITEAEIEDKSGRDALSKAIAMLQLTWFILQIAARVHQNLVVTELELTTAALASLNITMYVSWWSKPIEVLCPTIITSKGVEEQRRARRNRSHDSGLSSQASNTENAPDGNWDFHENVTTPLGVYYGCKFLKMMRNAGKSLLSSILRVFRAIPKARHLLAKLRAKFMKWRTQGTFRASTGDDCSRSILTSAIAVTIICTMGPFHAILHILLALILYPMQAILASGYFPSWRTNIDASEIDTMSTLDVIMSKKHLRLLMEMVFSSERVENSPFFCFSAITGAIFGAIHCAAWNFQFPSRVERLFWRVSSLCLLGICFLLLVCGVAYGINKRMRAAEARLREQQAQGQSLFQIRLLGPGKLMSIMGAIPAVFYIVSRVCLLVLSITTLRALPSSAFDTVQWSEFIPHI